jgi:CNT family concentrative nucleoside transporter
VLTSLQSLFGVIVFVGVAWSISEDRRVFPWRITIAGLGLQLVLAALLLKLPFFQDAFIALNRVILSLEHATQAGTSFVFGYLGGASPPFDENHAGTSFILAFRALPIILVVSALSALLFYWRVLPWIVQSVSRGLQKSLGIGGALGIGTAANIFVGMVEAPLFVRPYLKGMSRFELFALMTCGMATIAGTVMVLYASILRDVIPDAMGHILTASIISAPAAIMIAAIMVPPTDVATTGDWQPPQLAHSSMDAITKGTLQGVQLLINVIALLVVLVALVNLANILLNVFPQVDGAPVTLQRILGWIMAPMVWLMGIPWQEATTAGALMGTKTILNELLAYLDLAKLPEGALSPRSQVIMLYALCGFANFGSLGIMIGGLGTMVPERREEIVSLGLKSIVSGTLSTLLAGAIVGLLLLPQQ